MIKGKRHHRCFSLCAGNGKSTNNLPLALASPPVRALRSSQKTRHAGGRCSKALTQILAQTVSREPDFSLELQSAVHKGFLRANAEFLRKAERFCANDGTAVK